MDDLTKRVSDLVRRFPNPEDFIKEIENTDKPDKEKGDYFFKIGDSLFKISNFKTAFQVFNQALEYFVKFNDKVGVAKCYNNLGNTCMYLGDNKKAIEYQEKSLKVRLEIGDKIGISRSYGSLGFAYYNLGDFKKAIEYHKQSLKIIKEIGDKTGLSICYGNLGNAYVRLDDYKKAIEYNEKSLAIAKEIGFKKVEAGCYINLGCAYHELGDDKKAIEFYEKSIKIKLEIGDKSGESIVYANLGVSYEKLGDYKKAIEYYEKSIKITKEIGYKGLEANCYLNIGNAYRHLGNNNKAIEFFNKSLEMLEPGNIYAKNTYLKYIGEAYLDKENFEQAEKYYKQAIKIIENMRRENIPDEYKSNFWKNNISAFDNLIISNVRLDRKEEALENSERGKGRTVFDFILGRGIEEKFKPEPLSFKEIQELAKRIEKNLVLFRVTEKGTFSFILNPEGKFDLLEIPEFNSKRLEELTVKLEEGKSTGGWIHAYSNYKSVTDKIRPLLIEEKVVEAGKILKQEEEKWFKTMDDTLKLLYDELIGPVFKRFDKGEKVVIIPNRALNILPLHACFYEEPQSTDRHYLIEDYEISYTPNCNILDLCFKREKERFFAKAQNDKRGYNLFAIANPAPPYNLAFSEWEVEEIGKLFNTKEVYIKEEVKDKLLDKIANYDVIHLSTHGIYDLSSSLNSKLLLGKDINLTLEEIFDKIRIDKNWLVSLSTCESGLVDYRDIADEYIGLQIGFLYAGAPTVIASLWSVADFTTAFIMIKTYENIFKHGLNKTEALRKAQLWLKELTAEEALKILKEKELELEYSIKMAAEDLMPLRIAITKEDPQSKPFAHPYYWAGFQLFGA